MYERFTDHARRVIVLAQEEARLLNHNYIGTEHLLLGIVRQGEGPAAQALKSLGVSLSDVRQQVEQIIGRGQQEQSGQIPFTPRAKKVLELALREGLQRDHNFIDPEHLLLGLIREGEGVAVQALTRLGIDLHTVRQHVVQLLDDQHGREPPVPAAPLAERASTSSDQWPLDQALVRIKALEQRVDALERRLDTRPDAGELDQGAQ